MEYDTNLEYFMNKILHEKFFCVTKFNLIKQVYVVLSFFFKHKINVTKMSYKISTRILIDF